MAAGRKEEEENESAPGATARSREAPRGRARATETETGSSGETPIFEPPAATIVEVAPGDVLGGDYRVERAIGEGGMAVVLRAEHIHLRRKVAIKTLKREALSRPDLCARFRREALALWDLSASPHVVRILGYGETKTSVPFMVLEHLEGSDLEAELREHGALPPEEAVGLVLQVCDALADAHAAGIVHRDVKPSNLFLTRDLDGSRKVKVLDFGIAKVPLQGSAGARTRSGSFLGSLLFAAPEHVASAKDADERSDVYSVGATLYQMLTGALPVKIKRRLRARTSLDRTPPVPPSRGRPGIPEGLDEVVMKCLERDPDLRFQNVAVLARALLPYAPPDREHLVARIERRLQIEPSRVPENLPKEKNLPTFQPSSSPSAHPTEEPSEASLVAFVPPSRRPTGLILALIAAVVVALSLAVTVVLREPLPPREAANPAPAPLPSQAPGGAPSDKVAPLPSTVTTSLPAQPTGSVPRPTRTALPRGPTSAAPTVAPVPGPDPAIPPAAAPLPTPTVAPASTPAPLPSASTTVDWNAFPNVRAP